jgi:hypothetical protein
MEKADIPHTKNKASGSLPHKRAIAYILHRLEYFTQAAQSNLLDVYGFRSLLNGTLY